jgi:hypothetical protein
MMLRFLLRPVLALSLLLALPGWLIRPQPYAEPDLNLFFATSEDCVLPCFMGIHPGETHLEQAMSILRNHPWVDSYGIVAFEPRRTGFAEGRLDWTWSGLQPAEIDGSQPGQLEFAQTWTESVVSSLSVQTQWRTPLVQDWLEQPLRSKTSVVWNSQLRFVVEYALPARSTLLRVSTWMDCPATLLDLWHSRAIIRLSPWTESTSGPVVLQELLAPC